MNITEVYKVKDLYTETVKEWYYPYGNRFTAESIFTEWENKGKYVLSLVKNKKMCIQAGCNVGYFPEKLSNFFEEVHTWEPADNNIACIEKNSLPNNVKVHYAALGDEIGSVHISQTYEDNCGATQVAPGGDIPMETIDQFEFEPGLIWLDIEGYEYRALLGAKNTIDKHKPVIVIENKGHMPEFGGGKFMPDGDDNFVAWMKTINYKRIRRMMRDDIYIYDESL